MRRRILTAIAVGAAALVAVAAVLHIAGVRLALGGGAGHSCTARSRPSSKPKRSAFDLRVAAR